MSQQQEPREIHAIDETGKDTEQLIATEVNADQKDVDFVLSQPVNEDGRSKWVWLRLQNGDLVLATFPQGETYEAVSQRIGV